MSPTDQSLFASFSSEKEGLGLRRWIALALFAFLIYLPGRASLPPLDRDESRYMEATAQMLHTGNYVDVRFQDQPRYLQPAGIYWLEALAADLSDGRTSRSAWAYRIPSLLAATANVLLTAAIGAALFGADVGLAGAAMFALAVLVTAEARMATIDTTLLLAVLLAMWSAIRARLDAERGRPTSPAVAALYWVALGCGLMFKGPVVLIPGWGMPIALAAIERSTGWWRRLRPLWGIPLMLLIVVPWCVAIWIVSHGTFFERAVGTNFLGKVASGQQAHGLPPGFHLVVFLLAFWPGSFFAMRALPWVIGQRRSLQVRLLACWIVPHWLVFEAIATKLPHYVLPTYPAIALLAAASLLRGGPVAAFGARGWWRGWLGVYGALWLLAGLALALAGPLLLWFVQHEVRVLPIVTGALAGLAVLSGAVLVARGQALRGLVATGAGALVAYLGIFAAVIQNLTTIWLSPRIALAFDQVRPCADSVLASTSFSEPSLVFAVGQDTRLVDAAGAAAFLATDRRCGVALVGTRDQPAFEHALADRGLTVRLLGRVQGVNYSNGRHLDLGFFAVAGETP
nr:glycosyltransferase family 39 protein [Endobacter medicaginis]